MSPASGLVSILKKRGVSVDDSSVAAGSEPPAANPPPKRRVHFKVPDDGYEHGQFLFLPLLFVNVIINTRNPTFKVPYKDFLVLLP